MQYPLWVPIINTERLFAEEVVSIFFKFEKNSNLGQRNAAKCGFEGKIRHKSLKKLNEKF